MMHDFIDRRRFIVGLGAAMFEAPKNLASGKTVNDQIFELRQYTLFGSKRDALIDIFEQNFVESQEQLGLHVVGTLRDLDDPDRFVWIRGPRYGSKRKGAGSFLRRSCVAKASRRS